MMSDMVMGLPVNLGHSLDEGIKALGRIADALERQADVMEADLAAEEGDETEIVRLYGKALDKILDSPDALAKARGLREIAKRMMKHGTQGIDETGRGRSV